jgi:RNA polymerase sigma-70 factor (ECF subfamily)
MSKHLDAAILGDEKAMAAFLSDISPTIRKMITRQVGDYDDIEAIKQEVLIRVWRHVRGFKKGSELDTWLYRIVINCTNTYMTDKQEGKFVDFDDLFEDELETNPYLTTGSMEDAMIAIEEEEEKANAILAILGTAGLTGPQHRAMYLYLFQDMTYEEMAKTMGCTRKQVDNYLHDALEKLGDKREEINALREM